VCRAVLTAVQLPWFAIKTSNNFYVGWLARQSRSSRLAHALFKVGVGVQDILSSSRLMNPGLCVAFVFTGSDAESARDALRAASFIYPRIPTSAIKKRRRELRHRRVPRGLGQYTLKSFDNKSASPRVARSTASGI
jgi:hypothetical protein